MARDEEAEEFILSDSTEFVQSNTITFMHVTAPVGFAVCSQRHSYAVLTRCSRCVASWLRASG